MAYSSELQALVLDGTGSVPPSLTHYFVFIFARDWDLPTYILQSAKNEAKHASE